MVNFIINVRSNDLFGTLPHEFRAHAPQFGSRIVILMKEAFLSNDALKAQLNYHHMYDSEQRNRLDTPQCVPPYHC